MSLQLYADNTIMPSFLLSLLSFLSKVLYSPMAGLLRAPRIFLGMNEVDHKQKHHALWHLVCLLWLQTQAFYSKLIPVQSFLPSTAPQTFFILLVNYLSSLRYHQENWSQLIKISAKGVVCWFYQKYHFLSQTLFLLKTTLFY